jgi:hypothetical protein
LEAGVDLAGESIDPSHLVEEQAVDLPELATDVEPAAGVVQRINFVIDGNAERIVAFAGELIEGSDSGGGLTRYLGEVVTLVSLWLRVTFRFFRGLGFGRQSGLAATCRLINRSSEARYPRVMVSRAS